MPTIDEQKDAIVNELRGMTDWQERYRRIIEWGRALPELPESDRVEKNRIKGCQSQVWLTARPEGDRIRFAADSDAQIVRGLAAVVVRIFDNQPFSAVAQANASFIDELGLNENLSQTRSNGLVAMIKQIRAYGVAYGMLQRGGPGA